MAIGRLAGQAPLLVASNEIEAEPLQKMQSAALQAPLTSMSEERTPYSPFGVYPVSDGLIDFGEAANSGYR
jgi:hypothetical protein